MGKRRPTDLAYKDGRRASWEAIRQHVLRSQPVCACGAPTTEVDHIWPRYYGGDDQRSNLQALCTPCNRSKGNSVEPSLASSHELDCAVQAILTRAIAATDDLARFLTPLAARAISRRDIATVESLRLARDVLAVLMEEAAQHHDQASAWLAEARPTSDAEAAMFAMEHIFGGVLG